MCQGRRGLALIEKRRRSAIPTAAEIAVPGVVGLAAGSFLNVCIDRLPLGQSIVWPPSHCPACKHPLSRRDMVPVLNYLWLRGRCRYCRVPIPWRLPLVELLTGALFAYAGYRYGLAPEAWVGMAYLGLLLVLFFIDLEHSLVLNRVVYPAAPVALLLAPVSPPGREEGIAQAYLSALEGGGLGFGVLLLIYVVSRGGVGAGDVKLGALLGVMLGLSLTFVALPLSFIAGGAVALALLALKLRRRGQAIPFGPFLAGAAVVALFWGSSILEWYRGLFTIS